MLSLLGLWLAGVLTFASPCVLPLIPAYIAALSAGSPASGRGRPIASAASFALGMSLVFVILGAGASVAGAQLVAHRTALLGVSATMMVLFGLRALGVLRIGLLDRDVRPGLTRVKLGGSLGAAFLFGAAFAVGWSPCVGPLLASALAYAAAHAGTPWRGAGLLAVYASGIAAPLVATAALADVAVRRLREWRGLIPRLEAVSGAFMIAIGIWTAYGLRGPVESDMSSAQAASECSTEHAASGCALPSSATTDGEIPDISGPRLLEFVSADCPVCRKMAPVLAAAEAACAGVGARTARIDVGSTAGLTLARRFGVVGTPTFVLIGEDDVEHGRLVGEQPAGELESAIEATFGLRCQAATKPAASG